MSNTKHERLANSCSSGKENYQEAKRIKVEIQIKEDVGDVFMKSAVELALDQLQDYIIEK